MKIKSKKTEVREIPKDWEIKELGNCVEIIKKPFNPKNTIIKRYIGLEHIEQQNLRLMGIGSSKDVGSNKFEFKSGQILFGKLRPYFRKLFMPNFEGICSTDIWVINPKKGLDNHFMFYFLADERIIEEASKSSEGTKMPRARWDYLSKLEFPFPKLKEQQAIGKILSDLDAKIELNLQMNKTLEAIGQALFKHWFINFEFPNEKGKPYKSSGGEMIDSDLGEIPKGWVVEKLRNFVRVERGLSYKGSGLCEEGIPLINLGNIAPNNRFKYEGLKFYSGDYKERNLVKPGDLIIANTDITQKREVLGSCLIVPSDLGSNKLLFTHHIYAIRPLKDKETLPKHFLSYLLQTPEYRERTNGFATGTTVLALPEDAILDFNFVIPNKEILQEFDRLLTYIKEQDSKNIMESKNLSQIRDSLLPKLMSGKIRIK